MTSALAQVAKQFQQFVDENLDTSGLSAADRSTYYSLINTLQSTVVAAEAPLPAGLSELRKLAGQATPGPWGFREVDGNGAVCHPKGWLDSVTAVGPEECLDAQYIAKAHPQMVLSLLDALEVRGPQQLWGFFHTTCIYESAAALVSLHVTKREAWKAMHRAQWVAWEMAQAETRMRGDRRDAREIRKENPSYQLSKDRWWRKAYYGERSHIAPVALQF